MECFVWRQDLEEQRAVAENIEKEKTRARDKIRHAKYYKRHRKRILRKQNKYNSEAYRTPYSKEYWENNKETLKEKHHQAYQKNREQRLEYARRYYQEHKEEIAEKRRLEHDKG